MVALLPSLTTVLPNPGGGLAQPSYNCLKLDASGDVDLVDFGAFQDALTRP